MAMITCPNCGAELEEGATECLSCGCPVEEMNALDKPEKPQKVDVTSVKITKRVKVIIGIVVSLLIVGGGTFFLVNQYQKKKAAEEYANNLEMASYSMLSGAGEA